jgi:hypothetical protein
MINAQGLHHQNRSGSNRHILAMSPDPRIEQATLTASKQQNNLRQLLIVTLQASGEEFTRY